MSDSITYARVFPKSIEIVEKYNYHANISATQHIIEKNQSEEDKISGCIEILIPFDGEKYFSRIAAADIHRQTAKLPATQEVTVRIGYLGLTKYKNTAPEDAPELNPVRDVAPIDLQLRRDKLPKPAELFGNANACRIRYNYTPESPQNIPIRLDATLADDNLFLTPPQTIWDLLDKPEPKLTDRERQQLDETTQALRRQARKQGGLTLCLQPVLKLADPLAEGKFPTLASLTLKWPVAVSHNQVKLTLSDKTKTEEPKPIVYNPEDRVIAWGDLPLSRYKKSTSLDLHIYKTPQMRLTLDKPSELYHMQNLEGTVEIELPHALTGLQVEHFSATGQKSDDKLVPIEHKTVIKVDFNLALDVSFNQQTFAPYQHLQFDGVILDDMRISDIENVLEQHGFTARSRKLPSQWSVRRYLVAGRQTHALADAWLWFFVEGKQAYATRHKVVAGGNSYGSHIETGQVTMYIRGLFRGDKNNLTELMNDVQHRLKELFQHVSTVD